MLLCVNYPVSKLWRKNVFVNTNVKFFSCASIINQSFCNIIYFYHSCIIPIFCTHILTAFIYFIIIFFNATARIQVRRFNKKPDVIFEEETCIFSEGGRGVLGILNVFFFQQQIAFFIGFNFQPNMMRCSFVFISWLKIPFLQLVF